MHVLRVFLRSGVQIELLFRGKDNLRGAVSLLNEPGETKATWVHLVDDFGKDTRLTFPEIAGWQQSDYGAELEGALEIARSKQETNDKYQREMQKRHSLMVPGGAAGMPNGTRIIGG